MLRTIFWNETEHRFRFGWRIAGFGLLMIILIAVFSVVLSPALRAGALEYRTVPTFFAVSLASLLGTVLAALVAAVALDRRPLRDYGLRLSGAWWRDLAFGMALGAVLMGAIFLIEWAAGWITITGTLESGGGAFLPLFLIAVGAFVCIGIYEELAFRGVGLTNVAEWLHGAMHIPESSAALAATLVTALIFGVLHALNPNASVISTVNIVVVGATILSLGFLLTGELAIPIGVHITWNLFQAAVFGFPVSGIDISTTVIAIDQAGPTWLTGGAFGPEAGLLGLIATLVGGLLTVLWVRRTRGDASLATEIATPPGQTAT